jgi:hypothetical protein
MWGSRYARLVLKRCEGNKREASRVLGISYHTLIAYLRYSGQKHRKEEQPEGAAQADDVHGTGTDSMVDERPVIGVRAARGRDVV